MNTSGRRRTLDTGGVDLRRTLKPLGVYSRDPTTRWSVNSFAKAVLTPEGPGTMLLTWDTSGSTTAQAWGRGTDWLLERAPHWVGLRDDVGGFDPSRHSSVAGWARRHPGIRLPAGGVIWQELFLVLLGQRVTTEEAVRSWTRIVFAWGEPAPGPCDVRLPPTPGGDGGEELRRPSPDERRSSTRRCDHPRGTPGQPFGGAAAMNPVDARRRLMALRGLGTWTATSVINATHGDPDNIVLRDYGLPTLVNYAFAGEARRLRADDGGDEIMCGHLAPWAGHRQRVVRLIYSAGVSVPRRAPRSFNPDIRRL